MIGLSGLITPSLDEMVNVATAMEKNGFSLPLLIGGATTSEKHTAARIAPNYSGAVVHVRDASKGVGICRKLLDLKTRAAFITETKARQESLRQDFEKDRSAWKLVPLEEARHNRPEMDWCKATVTPPTFTGTKAIKNFDLKRVRERIDWSFFFLAWNLKGRYPGILKHPQYGAEATKLFNDAQGMLDEIIEKRLLSCNGALGLFPANSVEDDIEVYTDATRSKVLTTIHTLRQQVEKQSGEPYYALADFIAPKSTQLKSHVGAFAVTGGTGLEEAVKAMKGDDYRTTLLKTLADRLAEGFAEVLHEDVRKNYWGYAPDENLSNDELFEGKYRGIRPAPGYPACPDHTEKIQIFQLLDATKPAGIGLTETFMMIPAASVCGYYFSCPHSHYFPIGHIAEDQLVDYAKRKGWSLSEARKWLAPLL
jgi:5-methyltetrahydrofolate--homocysteine methyltransferase